MKNKKKINVIIVISTFNEDISNNLLEGASKRFIELDEFSMDLFTFSFFPN